MQFKLDGANLGAEDTTSPFAISWNTTSATNATHSLTAVARDAAGNTATATAVSVTVDNRETTPPTIAARAPAPGATGVAHDHGARDLHRSIVDITASTFVLRNAANTLVSAAVSYDAATFAATLTPSQTLAPGQTYTATVTGGSAGVKDLAGNAMVNDFAWFGPTPQPRLTVPSAFGVRASRTSKVRSRLSTG